MIFIVNVKVEKDGIEIKFIINLRILYIFFFDLRLRLLFIYLVFVFLVSCGSLDGEYLL